MPILKIIESNRTEKYYHRLPHSDLLIECKALLKWKIPQEVVYHLWYLSRSITSQVATLTVIFGLLQLFVILQYFHVRFASCHPSGLVAYPKNYVFSTIVRNIWIFFSFLYINGLLLFFRIYPLTDHLFLFHFIDLTFF